jgi:hypothetical protein
MKISIRCLIANCSGAPDHFDLEILDLESTSVGSIATAIVEHAGRQEISADKVKIIYGGAVLRHSATLAECRYLPNHPLVYTCPLPLAGRHLDSSILDFSQCKTVGEALEAVADMEATAPHASPNPFMSRDFFGKTSLHYACNHFEDAAVARSLISAGCNVNAVDHDGFTPLFLAKSADVFRELLRSRADPHILNNSKQTPLHYAASGEIVDILLASGCVSNPQYQPMTPLHNARNAEVAQRLIQHNADVNARTRSGKTPLHFVIDTDVAAALVSARADVTARDNRGNTALHYAHSPTLARFFLRAAVPVDASLSNGSRFSPIETIPKFETAVVLYEVIAFPASHHQKRRQLEDKVEFTANQRQRHLEFLQFNKELAFVSLSRRSAYVSAFGRNAAVSREFRTILSLSLRPWSFAFAENGDFFTEDMSEKACWAASLSAIDRRDSQMKRQRQGFLEPRLPLQLLSSISMRGAGAGDDDEDDDISLAGGAAAAGGAANSWPRLAGCRVGEMFFETPHFCISEVQRLRCTAAAGLAGFLVVCLVSALPPRHSEKVLRRSASSMLGLQLHAIAPFDKIMVEP